MLRKTYAVELLTTRIDGSDMEEDGMYLIQSGVWLVLGTLKHIKSHLYEFNTTKKFQIAVCKQLRDF